MKLESILALLRHGLTAAGGGLVTNGLASEDELSQGIGALLTLIGIGWSVFRKWKRSKASAAPIVIPMLLALLVVSGCARFSTIQTEIRNEQTTTIKTKAAGYSFFAGQAALAKWKAKQSDSTQQAEVGDLNVQSDATTNAAAIVEAVVRAAISAAK